ncbi:hypothetical protein QVD17_14076 [Tagetes erecta]|uniref:Rad60/SUMO-like domain-containing protein n=1 Tax=Tagetes erecta TaxID=13708 RepID=A0AAD8L1C5_TARER|nr:hypothetical protein QVD17_14076 [Tagetes erecta]
MSRANNNQGADITLTVNGQDGIEMIFRVKRSTPLKKLLNTYCFRHFVRPNCVTFTFLGCLFQRDQTPDELEMKEGDCIRAFFHQNEKQKVFFDEQIAKDNVREEEYATFVVNKLQRIIWRIISKLIAENVCLKEELTRLTKVNKVEDKDVALWKIGRFVNKSFRENSGPREELKKEVTRLRDELKEDLKEEIATLLKELAECEDEDEDDDDEDEDDEGFIDDGKFVSELIAWAKKNQDFVRCMLSKL